VSTHLRPVGDEEVVADTADTGLSSSGLPNFEGQPVDFARLKLGAVSDIEYDDSVLRIDDVVRMFVEGRVTRIDHVVDDKTGKLKRIHTVKVTEAIRLPWDFDAGVFSD
jgi:hypothetical protein